MLNITNRKPAVHNVQVITTNYTELFVNPFAAKLGNDQVANAPVADIFKGGCKAGACETTWKPAKPSYLTSK
jgi:hypothetical protein